MIDKHDIHTGRKTLPLNITQQVRLPGLLDIDDAHVNVGVTR